MSYWALQPARESLGAQPITNLIRLVEDGAQGRARKLVAVAGQAALLIDHFVHDAAGEPLDVAAISHLSPVDR